MLHEELPDEADHRAYALWQRIVNRMIVIFEEDNDRFDPDKFLEAVEGNDG
jgi:hypothetical protein